MAVSRWETSAELRQSPEAGPLFASSQPLGSSSRIPCDVDCTSALGQSPLKRLLLTPPSLFLQCLSLPPLLPPPPPPETTLELGSADPPRANYTRFPTAVLHELYPRPSPVQNQKLVSALDCGKMSPQQLVSGPRASHTESRPFLIEDAAVLIFPSGM